MLWVSCASRTIRTSANAEGPVSRAALKGLRHFSMKVCQKVESKGRTTYNEVADELVRDFSSPETSESQTCCQPMCLPPDHTARKLKNICYIPTAVTLMSEIGSETVATLRKSVSQVALLHLRHTECLVLIEMSKDGKFLRVVSRKV